MSPPYRARSSVGIGSDGKLSVGRVSFFGYWQGLGQRRPLTGLNQPPRGDGTSLFTPAWGPTTPSIPGVFEAVLQPFPPAVPGTDLTGVVTSTHSGGGLRDPEERRGAARARLAGREAPGRGDPGHADPDAADPPARLARDRRHRRARRRARDRAQRQARLDGRRGLPAFAARPAQPAHRGRPARRREDHPARRRRASSRLQRRNDELGARAGDGQARRGDCLRARRGRLDDDGLRRQADEPAFGPRRRALGRRVAGHPLHRRLRAAARALGRLAER